MVFSLMVRCRLTRQLGEVMMLSTRSLVTLLLRFFSVLVAGACTGRLVFLLTALQGVGPGLHVDLKDVGFKDLFS